MGNLAQRSFSSGEISPALYARTDQAKYANALRTCRNFVVLKQGAAQYRPGTDFIAETYASGEAVRLIPFVFNQAQTFVVVFNGGRVQFIRDGAMVEVAGIVYSIASPYAAADLAAIQYAQSADVITLTHPSYPPYELRRLSNTSWTLTAPSFNPLIAAPTGLLVFPGTPGPGSTQTYVVTAVSASGEESLISNSGQSLFFPTPAFPDLLVWDVVADAVSYHIYCSINGGASGFIGATTLPTFSYYGDALPDVSVTPPVEFTGFTSTDNYPSCVAYYQQRLLFANTNNEPEKVWCSRTGAFHNFTVSTPVREDDAVIFSLANTEVMPVRFLLDLGKLIVGAEGGEWLIEGDANGILTPFAINARVGSYNGVNTLRPLRLDNTLLYVQALGTVVQELKSNIQYGYYTFTGADVTLFAAHLFDGYQIMDWAYAQIPNYTAWAVRNDGVLLGCTYISDQQLLAWHRHDTDGTFENVVTIPEGTANAVYVVVKRTINRIETRYLERLTPLTVTAADLQANAAFMDSALTYDGTNTDASITMTLVGGVSEERVTEADEERVTEGDEERVTEEAAWTFDTPVLVRCSAAVFTVDSVGQAVVLTGDDGTVLTVTLSEYVSPTEMYGFPDRDVPASMQNVAISVWALAVAAVGNLAHLEGKAVSVYADGYVAASPNNPSYTTVTVVDGVATLDEPYVRIRVGLPYIGDFETLDIDTPSGPSLKEERMAITRVGLFVMASRGIFAGRTFPTGADAIDGLLEYKLRDIDALEVPVALTTGYVYVNVQGKWDDNGRIVVRQVDPVPLTILAAMPMGFIPGQG